MQIQLMMAEKTYALGKTRHGRKKETISVQKALPLIKYKKSFKFYKMS